MQLVEFDDAQGHKVWINPAQITHLKPHSGNPDVTDLHFENATVVRVAGRICDVAQKLNQGLKE